MGDWLIRLDPLWEIECRAMTTSSDDVDGIVMLSCYDFEWLVSEVKRLRKRIKDGEPCSPAARTAADGDTRYGGRVPEKSLVYVQRHA